MDGNLQTEVVALKARLFELDNEKQAVRDRLFLLLGKAEGIAEMERLIDAKVHEAIKAEAPK